MKLVKEIDILTAVFDLVNFIISFFICRWFYMKFLYFYAIGIIGFSSSGVDFFRPLLAILTIILFTLLRMIYTKKISINIVRFLYILYFAVLIFMLFFKSLGVQGINLNLVAYFRDLFTIDYLVPVFNLLLFVPLGFLFAPTYKNLLFFLSMIFVCELMQYVLKVGIFDVGDILFNTLGFLFGSALTTTNLWKKVKELIQ